jgi:fucose 4-O-acetylase-like acetyltransferase
MPSDVDAGARHRRKLCGDPIGLRRLSFHAKGGKPGFVKMSHPANDTQACTAMSGAPTIEPRTRAVTGATNTRDPFLDCLKGIAIVLVVCGHTFQGMTPDFDSLFPFRIVYSFHMPMFMFASGMVAALSFQTIIFAETIAYAGFARGLLANIARRVPRLLLPFFAWGIVTYFFRADYSRTLGDWILLIIAVPDYGLWFLVALFHCTIVLALAGLCALALRGLGASYGADLPNRRFLGFATIVVSGIIAKLLLSSVPNVFGLVFAKTYFPYFFLGLLYQMYRPNGFSSFVRFLPYLVFPVLAPFWSRVEPSIVVDQLSAIIPRASAATLYSYAVALSGTLITIDAARCVVLRLPHLLSGAVAYCGRRSLDIYAIHIFVIGCKLAIVGPVVISLLTSLLLRQSRILDLVLFGEWNRSPTQLQKLVAIVRSRSAGGIRAQT